MTLGNLSNNSCQFLSAGEYIRTPSPVVLSFCVHEDHLEIVLLQAAHPRPRVWDLVRLREPEKLHLQQAPR